MPQGTLANLATSAFVRTPPAVAERLVRFVLTFPPGKPINVLDPTAGEGDLLLPCRDIPFARLSGVEISAERADVARERLPRAEIVTCAFEGVSMPKASMSLILANPPYFFQDGKRAEYRILADAGTLLVAGGVLVAILPARSAWDGTMINHWARWYEQVRVWKFPDRTPSSSEGAFEDYTQICVVGIRRAEPVDPSPAEQRRLQGYRYHTASPARSLTANRGIRAGWEQGTPPPELPTVPLADPYVVPEATLRPHIVVRHADEALLLAALEHAGAHLSPLWQAATAWREEGLRESPVMPLSGEAHVAAEVLTGLLDGEIVSVPTMSTHTTETRRNSMASPEEVGTTPYLFTAFVGQEWVSLPIDEEEQEKLRERGVVHVAARQWQDKPILGVLNLQTGETRYEQGEAVFTFLQPWLGTLAERVIEKRQPLYRLDPADWELRVVAQFGQDKQLPNAAFPGLSIAQQHRVYAMGRALDVSGRTAIQGEPGTGKTRLGVATAARQAYQWRHRTTLFQHGSDAGVPPAGSAPGAAAQPAWIRGLRQAWLKNPRTLALLRLTPIRDEQTGRIVAYRRADGPTITPEEAGPRALPVLVSTPKKVTKEYAQEIHVAWPEAEVVHIAHHSDIPRWLAQCAESSAPCVIGILSHSLSRAFGRAWQPVMQEKRRTQEVPDLEPPKTLLPQLEPVQNARGQLAGYRWKEHGTLYTRVLSTSHFFCPDCGAQVQATPGKLHDVEPRRRADEEQLILKRVGQTEEDEDRDDDDREPVTSRTWFTLKPRWCRCRADVRNQPGPRNPTGSMRVRTPLWTDARLAAAQRKQPQLSFAGWHTAVHALRVHASRSASAKQPGRQAVSLGRIPTGTAGASSNGGRSQRNQHDQRDHSGMLVMDTADVSYGSCVPLPESFAPCDYLYRFYRGCVALTIVDESHNGRGRDTDIAHAHHQAMLSAQTRMLTSGTHFGGDVLGFYHYWFRYHPQFWRRLGLGWNDAEKALERYGVVQEWTKEYESDARRGSGQTSVQVSTIPAPGLSAKLIPYLLEDLVYLTVLDVGAHMPPRIEIPEIVSMRDPEVSEALERAAHMRADVARRLKMVNETPREPQHVGRMAVNEAMFDVSLHSPAHVQEQENERQRLRASLHAAVEQEQAVQTWAKQRHLAAHYGQLVRELDDLARERNTAARLAKGTVPRWFAALPCDRPFEVWQTTRDRWGDTLDRTLLVKTETLEWQYLYPLERRLIALVERERAEGRRCMIYFEQNDLRSMAKRLAWVLADFHPWTLPNSVPAEERQQAIIQAVQQHGHTVVIVPYRRVNEGLNLQSAIDSIFWIEMALNLFMLDQASRRAWRLGKREAVRIYYLTYANTAGHHKLRKLGQQSGAAAAFAGEPARGALIEHAGANKTTLARLSSLLEQQESEDDVEQGASVSLMVPSDETEIVEEEATLKAVFARRAEELRAALSRGRTWLGGLSDTLEARLISLRSQADHVSSVWMASPPLVHTRTFAPVLVQYEEPSAALHGQDSVSRNEVVVVQPSSMEGSVSLVTPSGEYTVPLLLPPVSPQPEPTPIAAPAIGSRADVIFGRREHIALARVRRSQARRRTGSHDPVQRKQPVVVREIASLAEAEAQAQAHATHATRATGTHTLASPHGQMVVTPSLWDQGATETAETAQAGKTHTDERSPLTLCAVPPVRSQPRLWG